MSLSFTHDQRDFRASVRATLTRHASAAQTREFIEGRSDAVDSTWRKLDEAVGLAALPIAERLGGQGASWSEVGLVFEELGRVLYPTPYLPVMAAARVLMRCNSDAAEAVLRAIAEGSSTPMVSFAGNVSGRFDAVSSTPHAPGTQVQVSGTSGLVPYHAAADTVLVAVRLGRDVALVSLPADETSIDVVPTIDLTRPACTITATSVSGMVLSATDMTEDLRDVRAFIATMTALESIGGADVCLAKTTDYARERIQFGSAIGSFQGVKHRCADLLRVFEPARSAAYAALAAANGADLSEFGQVASIAKLVADQVYAEVSIESVQMHGAIGFTWEYDLHLHYKRAIANRAVGASAKDHRAAVRTMIQELLSSHFDREVRV